MVERVSIQRPRGTRLTRAVVVCGALILNAHSERALAATGGAPNTGSAPGAVAATPKAPAPTASTAPNPSAAPNPSTTLSSPAAPPLPTAPGAGASPHGAVAPGHGGQQFMQLMVGDPLASETHRQQADLARSERAFQAQNISRAEPGMRAGSIGVLVRDANGTSLAGRKIVLKRVHESIAEGNKADELTQVTNNEGHAGFLDLSTNTDFQYTVVTNEGPAQYSSGQFRLDRQHGQLVVLTVYPVTADINKTFIGTRVLYIVEPRDDVFQIQALYRFHNTNPMTWVPEDFRVRLPQGGKAFRPANKTGDLQLIEENGAVRIKGTFGPGEHEVSFAFQLDNPAEPTARLSLPLPPHTMDAKLYVEASPNMGVTSPHLDAATEARGKQGQRALMAMRDFVRTTSARPPELTATITGLPTRGSGPLVASLIALAVAVFGVSSAISNRRANIAASDRQQARELLLRELVEVEKAFRSDLIGPKTYEQTRRSLLDALVRIEAVQS